MTSIDIILDFIVSVIVGVGASVIITCVWAAVERRKWK